MGDELRRRADHRRSLVTVSVGDGRGERHVLVRFDGMISVAVDQRHVDRLKVDGGEQHLHFRAGRGDHEVELLRRSGGSLAKAPLLGDQPDADTDRHRDQRHEQRVGPAVAPHHGAHQSERPVAARHDETCDQRR